MCSQTEVRQRIQSMRECCRARWPAGSLQVVLLIALGEDERSAASILNLSDRSVRRRLERARAELTDGLGEPATTHMLITWLWLHSGCYSRPAFRALCHANRLEGGRQIGTSSAFAPPDGRWRPLWGPLLREYVRRGQRRKDEHRVIPAKGGAAWPQRLEGRGAL